ncbi:MAG: hypothetical protein FJ318_06245 [SAR202 cluster bacterium]|nr:hypothetical protein [SAR202 cluster bacterium]
MNFRPHRLVRRACPTRRVPAGLVYATWDAHGPSLDEYLGDARWYPGTQFNRFDAGTVALGPQKWIEPVNWKAPVDNCSDNYHVPVSHASSARVQVKFRGRAVGTPSTHAAAFAAPHRHVFVNGHKIMARIRQDGDPLWYVGMDADAFKVYKEWYLETLPEKERRLGSFRARHVQIANHSIFPNTALGFRLALPRGPRMTEFWSFVTYDKNMPAEVVNAIRRGHAQNIGVSGLNEQDDIDNWRQVSQSGGYTAARDIPQDLSMGVGHAGPHDRLPGEVAEILISENNQRHFYRRWQEFMNARSWDDIAIRPKTAVYEGTAGMRG